MTHVIKLGKVAKADPDSEKNIGKIPAPTTEIINCSDNAFSLRINIQQKMLSCLLAKCLQVFQTATKTIQSNITITHGMYYNIRTQYVLQ